MLETFTPLTVERQGVQLHTRAAGAGTPVLLLHGHPQSMAMWHRVAPVLAQTHRVVLMDLRGYGDSSRLEADAAHHNHSKREMALDALAVMKAHGFERFDVLAHDRGARVAHRLAADAPDAVKRLLLLDIAPTLAMYENTSEAFARAYWHWFFMIQPPPLPEALIESDPARYVRGVMGARYAGLAAFAPEALAEYERCAALPGTARSIAEDYRASASLDLEHDRADVAAGRQLLQPLRVLWGQHGAVGRCFDVLALWRERAAQVTGCALDCGHYLAEEAPEQVIAQAQEFFTH
ncbi:alpha/beta hydrolase [Limnohabitans sp. MMS-10A-160]|uniref:alpha/beta fold hydrolase n=1 Tax=unclassified Limnohabitans TaxID=2626134 RepID=UPI000D37D3D8|nr:MULTISPECIES: alpha/beta hydrolase [unclassified Limnohabitans]PUE22301.1 alpha/beta hydrolase [Limnohabitans sp. MMS-10A-192]PUE25949.1 alpha/beta hydrolase [Limnohabitans sp. MMS-10A-160]